MVNVSLESIGLNGTVHRNKNLNKRIPPYRMAGEIKVVTWQMLHNLQQIIKSMELKKDKGNNAWDSCWNVRV